VVGRAVPVDHPTSLPIPFEEDPNVNHRRSSKIIAAVAGLSLVLAACGGDDDTTVSPPATDPGNGDGTQPPPDGADGGTLIWAHEQEPPDLHLDDPENNLSITSWIRQSMWEGLYGITEATTFFPELLAQEGEITENADGGVTGSFVLREGLQWSDGEPLTSADVEYTYNMVMATGDDGEYIYLLGDRTGLDTITDFTVISDTEFEITWSEFFSGFPALFSEVHPAHIFSDDPAEAAAQENDALREWSLNGTVLPSSGPLIFDSWNRGQNMNFVRNDNYHGSVSPDVQNTGVAFVDAVRLNFVTDTDAQINALRAGEAQLIFTQPQTAFEQFATDANFSVASAAGPVYEHWGFNLFNVHLAKPEVREAIAFAIDKGEVMAGLYTPLFGDALPAEGLGNTYWMSNQPDYVDHQGNAGYGQGDIESAQAALEAAGYTQGADGIYEHPEDGPLSLRVGTTGGNVLREVQLELLQAGLRDAGIDITFDNVQGGAYFGERPFAADAIACANSGGEEGNCDIWDITQFAWVGGPWPGSNSAAFRSGSGNNPYGYANADFDALATECDATIDDAERAECYNTLDQYVTTLEIDPNGLVVVPLTQKPSFYAYSNSLSQAAVSPDANSAGPLVNVVDYRFG
jgi:peptide/nickel transport system substrate-binding protein